MIRTDHGFVRVVFVMLMLSTIGLPKALPVLAARRTKPAD
jgi:hypothetical protein